MTQKALCEIFGGVFPAAEKVVAGVTYGPYSSLVGTLDLSDPINEGTGIIKRMRNLHAVVWAIQSHDAEGAPVYAAPVEVMCRWTDEVTMFRTADGEQRASKAVMYPSIHVLEGSLAKQCRLAALESTDPAQNDLVYTVGGSRVVRKIRNNGTLYVTYLI